MKKSELKKLIKPLVKECIQETFLEDGLLSNVIAEVVKGLNAQPVLRESAPPPQRTPSLEDSRVREVRQQLQDDREKLIASLKKDTFNGVNLFEGTEALSSYEAGTTKTQAGAALAGVDPKDPGVDISGIVALGGKNWKALVG